MLNLPQNPKWDMARVSHSTLVNADCFDVFPLIADKSIDAIICDLPYGTTANKWDSVLDLNKLWAEYERILTPKGNIVLFGVGLFAFKLALSNEKLFRYDMVWKKSKCGSPFTAKHMPLKKHEMILIFGKPASKYNPQMVDGKPYKRTSKKGTNNMNYGAKDGFEYGSLDGKRHPNTILDFAQKWRRQDQLHPTQKPLALMEWIVKAYTNEGDVVLDNTMGSGTTGLACLKTNRQFIGIEKEKQYYDVAVRRLSSYCG
jgi:site-specific DNA-methyltransferase (adenine-specific)